MVATLSPIAPGPWGDGLVLRRRATAPPGRVSCWCRAPPTPSARHARAVRHEPAGGAPGQHHRCPSRVAPACPTRRACPSTAPGASDRARQVARGIAGAVACRVATPQGGTSGRRRTQGRAPRRSPGRRRPGTYQPCPGGRPTGASPPTEGVPRLGKLLSSKAMMPSGAPNRSATWPTHTVTPGRCSQGPGPLKSWLTWRSTWTHGALSSAFFPGQ